MLVKDRTAGDVTLENYSYRYLFENTQSLQMSKTWEDNGIKMKVLQETHAELPDSSINILYGSKTFVLPW